MGEMGSFNTIVNYVTFYTPAACIMSQWKVYIRLVNK